MMAVARRTDAGKLVDFGNGNAEVSWFAKNA